VDLLVEVLPIKHVGQPGEAVAAIEDRTEDLPGPAEGVNEEHVEGEWDGTVVHDVGVLEVDCGVLDIVAGIQEQLSLAVELECLRWLIYLISALEVLRGTLGQFGLCSPDDLVQVLHLAKVTLGLVHKSGLSLGESSEGLLAEERLVGSAGIHQESVHHSFY